MDFEYSDDADDNEVAYFAAHVKEHPFSDDDVKSTFKIMMAGEHPVSNHDELTTNIRERDVDEARVTRVCKSMDNHIFRIQFLNGETYIVKFNNKRTFENEIRIMALVRNHHIPVPKNFRSHDAGMGVGKHLYFVLLQEYVSGLDFETAHMRKTLTSVQEESILAQMGSLLKMIHSIGIDEADEEDVVNENYFDDMLAELDDERELIISQEICGREEFEEIYSKIDSLRSAAKLLSNQSFALSHMDYHPKHMMLSDDSNHPVISSIIDWGDATFTNRYFDFALWDFWCGEDFLIDSLMESYGMEYFTSAESKVNVEITTIAALVETLCAYAHRPELRATQLGIWQRLTHEVRQATY
jgi:aminoglycoside phosphotransferase (APT) family kinase protein